MREIIINMVRMSPVVKPYRASIPWFVMTLESTSLRVHNTEDLVGLVVLRPSF
jgi:hypothetical protein